MSVLRCQVVVQCQPLIKDKTATVKVLATHFFKVLEDAPLELQHPLHPGLSHEKRRFFAAYAAGALAHNGLAREFFAVIEHSLRKLAEL